MISPSSAGFDGFIVVGTGPHSSTPIALMRGSVRPSAFPHIDFTKQLLMHTPEDAPPQLLWCNADGEWFDVSFTPIKQP